MDEEAEKLYRIQLKQIYNKLLIDTENPSFDKAFIKGISLDKIRSNKYPIVSANLSKSFKNDVRNSVYRAYIELEFESMKLNSSLNQIIKKSSQTPFCIYDDDMEKNARTCSKDMLDFCALTPESSHNEKFQKDAVYNNCIVVPLGTILSKTDRHCAVVLAKERISSKLRKDSSGRIRKIELWRVFNNHAENSLTKSPVQLFFKSIFKAFDNEIECLMNKSDVNIILLVDHEAFMNRSNKLHKENIIGAIAFTLIKNEGTVIDLVAIKKSYHYCSFGPILIHLAQITASKMIEKIPSFTENQEITFLICRSDVINFYKSIGFDQYNSLEQFQTNGKYPKCREQMKISSAININDDLSNIMTAKKNCYRMRNFIDPVSYTIEDYLYNEEIFRGINRNIQEMDLWKSKVDNILSEAILKTKTILLDNDMLNIIMNQNDFIPYKIVSDNVYHFPFSKIGELFNECYEAFVGKGREVSKKRDLMISSGPLVLKNLCCSIWKKKYTEIEFTSASAPLKEPLWIELVCKKCGQSCSHKNSMSEPFSKFMLKAIFSSWYGHIYAYEIDETNKWTSHFPNWFYCKERKGQFLDDLKNASFQDEAYMERNKWNPDLTQFRNFLLFVEQFLDIYATKYDKYLEALSDAMSNSYLKYLESNHDNLEQETSKSDSEKYQSDSQNGNNESSNSSSSSNSLSLSNSSHSHSNNDNIKTTPLPAVTKKKKTKSTTNVKNKEKIRSILPAYDHLNVPDKIVSEDHSDDSIDLNEFLLDKHNDDYFLNDQILNKVNNKNIEKQKSLYLEEKKTLDSLINSPLPSRGLKQFMLRKKKLEKTVQTSKANIVHLIKEELWNLQANKDLKIQTKLDNIEFVKVKYQQRLHPVSDQYIKSINMMSKDEKDQMMESKKRSNFSYQDHYLMHYGKHGKAIVVHPNWLLEPFNEQNEQRINKATIDKCVKTPNTKVKLQINERKRIAKAAKLETSFAPIHYIKRIKTTGKTRLVFTDGNKRRSSHGMVHYIGYDREKRSRYLTDEWIDINFKYKTPNFYKRLKTLPVDTTVEIPVGTSNNINLWSNIPEHERGPPIQFQQTENDECLFFSLASAFKYMNHHGLCDLVLNEYSSVRACNRIPSIQFLVSTLSNHKNQPKNYKKVKFMLQKIKKWKTSDILNDMSSSVLYHLVLGNKHSIVLYEKFIFDPIFPQAIARHEKHIRLSAESCDGEDTDDICRCVYKYTF